MESSVLLAMAFDRFVAISDPLRYAIILTDSRITQIGVAIVIRGTLTLTPMVALLTRLSYCHSRVLHHSYCFHPDVMKLSCTDTRLNNAVGLTAMISTVGVDSILIPFSYVLIIKTILSIASPEERKKAFSTCISHIGAVAIFYIPLISLSFVHRFGKRAPAFVHTVIANTYLLLPPVMNPIIYSVKTKQIRRAVIKILHSKDTKNHRNSLCQVVLSIEKWIWWSLMPNMQIFKIKDEIYLENQLDWPIYFTNEEMRH